MMVDEAWILYKRGGIPRMERQCAKDKVIALFTDWQSLLKHKTRESVQEAERRKTFLDRIELLCDLTAADAINIIRTDKNRTSPAKEEDIAFQIDQQGSRISYLSPEADKKYEVSTSQKWQREAQKLQRVEKEQERFRMQQHAPVQPQPGEEDQGSGSGSQEWVPSPPKRPHSRASSTVNLTLPRNIMSDPDIAAVTDRCKIYSRQAAMLLGTVLKKGGATEDEVCLSRKTSDRCRTAARQDSASMIKENFTPPDHSVLYWDGKLLADADGDTADRLAVMLSGNTQECRQGKLLGVHGLPSGTAKSQTEECIQLMAEWKVSGTLIGTAWDTTAMNTDHIQGTAVTIEKHLGKKLLYLACRHHSHELIVRDVWEALFGKEQAPHFSDFKRVQDQWHTLDQNQAASSPLSLKTPWLLAKKAEVTDFLLGILSEKGKLPRDDYKEMCQLSLVLLGHTPPSTFGIRKPGAFHKARWMAIILYSSKMMLFNKQLGYSKEKCFLLQRFSLFTSLFYVKHWMSCSLAVEAPGNDLKFIKDMVHYRDHVDTTV